MHAWGVCSWDRALLWHYCMDMSCFRNRKAQVLSERVTGGPSQGGAWAGFPGGPARVALLPVDGLGSGLAWS